MAKGASTAPAPWAPLAPGWLLRTLSLLAALAGLVALAALLHGGFDRIDVLGLAISARDPLKPALVFCGLLALRLLLGLPGRELAAVAFGTALALGLGELGLRVVDHPWARAGKLRGLHRASPALGWELIPGTSGFDLGGYQVAINSAGFRDREWSVAKAHGVRRIAVLGDSFTFGMGVEQREAFPSRLQELLGPGVEVMDFGVVGYNVYQCEVTFATRAAAYHPDLVLYAAFFNDTMEPLSPEAAEAQQQNPLTQAEPTAPPGRLGGSYLVNFLKNAFGVLWSFRHRASHQATWLRSVEDRQKALATTEWKQALIAPAPPPAFSESLVRLRDGCRAHGCGLAVLLIPDIAQLGAPEWQGFNRWLADRCRSMSIPFRDATPAMEAGGPPAGLYLLPHDAHTSAGGHAVLAREAAALIVGLPPP